MSPRGDTRARPEKMATASVPGWTVVEPDPYHGSTRRSPVVDGRTHLRVYPTAWATRSEAEEELAHLVRPYPPGHRYRLELRVAWWDGSRVVLSPRAHLRLVPGGT